MKFRNKAAPIKKKVGPIGNESNEIHNLKFFTTLMMNKECAQFSNFARYIIIPRNKLLIIHFQKKKGD